MIGKWSFGQMNPVSGLVSGKMEDPDAHNVEKHRIPD
jgi:hypothetical protein